MTSSACPCDNDPPRQPDNPPGLERIGFRHADWLSIRRALLATRDGEDALAAWRPGGTQDLALMVAEWWATLGEVLEFYNEEIANEAFLGTAARPESVTRLISLLGYRRRPGLAATATLAAIVGSRDPLTLPQGFQIESLPAPGKQPQIFETLSNVVLAPGGRIDAQPVPSLVSPEAGLLYVEGRTSRIAAGDLLRLRAPSGEWLFAVTAIAPTADKPVRTRIAWTASGTVPTSLRAADCRLERPVQLLPVWSMKGAAVSGTTVHLAGISRSVGGGDSVLVSQPGRTPLLVGVTQAADLVWYANPPGDDPSVPPEKSAVPVPHSQLTLASALDAGWSAAAMRIGVGWIEIAPLSDQHPAPWTGSPKTLEAIAPSRFADAVAQPVLVSDADGVGVPAGLSSVAGATTGTVAVDNAYAVPLASPLALLTQTLAVARGKTVAREVLGSGDARSGDQAFTLAKAPVTYLRRGAGYASTVTVRVDGVPWQEVGSFYGQPADAPVFTLRENGQGKTVVQFGDGVNGRRLPSGTDNIIATYRTGSGEDAPGAGKLTRIVSPMTGLAKILNPVAAGGGADPEPVDEMRAYAPRSVLTFGRAVSVADYEAIAAQAVAPNRIRAVWAWDEVTQRTAVTVYVAGGPDKRAVLRDALAAAGDPHRPVSVQPASPVRLGLVLTLLVARGYESAPIVASANAALTGDDGLFSAARMGIGQYLFTSAIAAAVLPIQGVVTLLHSRLTRIGDGFATDLTGSLQRLDEGEWFDLSPGDLTIGIEVSDG